MLRKSDRRRSPRGQATVEYSVVSHALIFFGATGLLPVIVQLLNAISTFYQSVYTVVQTAAI
jgi:hypothetical protein